MLKAVLGLAHCGRLSKHYGPIPASTTPLGSQGAPGRPLDESGLGILGWIMDVTLLRCIVLYFIILLPFFSADFFLGSIKHLSLLNHLCLALKVRLPSSLPTPPFILPLLSLTLPPLLFSP